MAQKATTIPVNNIAAEAGAGIAIYKITVVNSYIEEQTTANGFEVAV